MEANRSFRESDQYGTTEVQMRLLNVLSDFDAFCKNAQIQYSLGCGTLLGAIRHNGFIPWDDDADIIMDRANFEKLLASWQDTDTFVMFRELWIYRIGERAQPAAGERALLDVFVFDHCPDSSMLACLKKLLIRFLQGTMHTKLDLAGKRFDYKALLLLTYAFGRLLPEKTKYSLYDSVSRWGNDRDSRHISCYNDLFKLIGLPYDPDLFSGTEEHVFEGRSFPIVKNWDRCLKTVYGDYMTPPKESERIPTHIR